MRFLVLGTTGILGSAVAAHLRDVGADFVSVVGERPALRSGPYSVRADITDPSSVFDLVATYRPDVILNCAGLTKARCSEAERAWEVNAGGPMLLQGAANYFGARLVHISTDCVFSGKQGPYTEASTPDAVDIYGMSKKSGEVTAAPHLTVRCSFIGFEVGSKHGLLAWILSQQGRAVDGYVNHLWNGVTAPVLARAVTELSCDQELTGLIHLAGEVVSKANLLHTIVRSFGLDIEVRDIAAAEPIDRRLASIRRDVTSVRVPSIETMVDELASEWRSTLARTSPHDRRD